jgi:predicted HD phosphohydrolase
MLDGSLLCEVVGPRANGPRGLAEFSCRRNSRTQEPWRARFARDIVAATEATAMERKHFSRMDQSTREQWMFIAEETVAEQQNVPKGIVQMLKKLGDIYGGFGVSQLHHALQTATMAKRDNASDEVVLAALCHDIGKAISIANHAEISASILRKYVSADVYQVVLTHQDFQGRHYYEYFDQPSNLREHYRNESWFALAEKFTDEWDQLAFDPKYKMLPLSEFEPLVQQFFGTFKM